MKVIVLHGDNTPKLYARLSRFLETARIRNWEVINDEIVPTASLFGKERLFVFRNYSLLSQKQTRSLEKLPGTLVIYNEGTVPKTFLQTLPQNTKVEEFKLPSAIFKFLESFSLKLLHNELKDEPPEFILALLAKHLRDLYWVKSDLKTLKYPSWRIAKLKKQASLYSQEKLKEIIEQLAEIDIKIKTSKADLVSSLDLLILTKLE